MKVFKRSAWSVAKLLLLAPLSAVMAYLIAGIMAFRYQAVLQYSIPPIVFLTLLYVALFSERVRLELYDTGTLRQYRGGALAGEYQLPLCSVGRGNRGKPGIFGSHGGVLFVLEPCSEQVTQIDCSALHIRDFDELYRLVHAAAGGEITETELA